MFTNVKRIFTILLVMIFSFAFISTVNAGEFENPKEIEQALYEMHKTQSAKDDYKEFIKFYSNYLPKAETMTIKDFDNLIKAEMLGTSDDFGNVYNAATLSSFLAITFKRAGEKSLSNKYMNMTSQINQMTGGQLDNLISNIVDYYRKING